MAHLNTGDTAWLLMSSALVLLMTPGLALFYGGMVRVRSVLNMLMMSFASIGVVTLLWVLYGFQVAFGSNGGGLWGGPGPLGLAGLTGQAVNGQAYPVPAMAFVAFQLMFAVITPALVSGAIADRMRFGAWLAFVALWVSLCYFPVAHWVFSFGDAAGRGSGWLARLGVLDFAGGTAVHVNAGAAGLALALVLGRRIAPEHRPHNVPLVMLGAGLLWFGWFGFNAGSALVADGLAAAAFVNTQVAAAAAVLGWMALERIREGHYSPVGAASGAVAGLVAITPACAYVTPVGSIYLGLAAGAACQVAVSLKWRLGFDDSLDVVGVHLVGGALGSVGLGVLATRGGLLYGGDATLLWKQAVAVAAVGGFSFAVAWLVGTALDRLVGLRVPRELELAGIDLHAHAGLGYALAHLEALDGPVGATPTSVASP